MRTLKDVYVTMRDGVRIGTCIYLPDAEGQFPTLFAISPYQYDTGDLPQSSLFLWHELGPVEWYTRKGYAYVHADVRGTGKSEGVYRFFDRAEQQDYYELIEWVARQPWSNGKVGGIGQSYYGMAQWWMGIVRPPHLACIAPYDGMADFYRDCTYHGGILCDFFCWWYNMVRANNSRRAAEQPTGKAMREDITWEFISRGTLDDWWRERSPYERLSEITMPVLSIGHWGKLAIHLRGNILGYEEVKGPRKLVVTGAEGVLEAHALFFDIAFHETELLPFYDRYLNGIDNGFMEGPPVKLFVRGDDAYRGEEEWPLKRATYVPYYLRRGPSESVTSLNDGGLSTEAPGREEGSTLYSYPDPQWTWGTVSFGKHGLDPVARILTFTTPPLEEDLEVTGPIVLELYASSTQIDTDFFAKLSDQHPLSPGDRERGLQPPFTVVSKGWLRASHREKDEGRSKPYRPFYTHRNPQPIERDKIYKFEIEVFPASYVFKRGHRIRLELANGDSPLTEGQFPHQYSYYKVGRDTIYHDASQPSRLLLPVIPR